MVEYNIPSIEMFIKQDELKYLKLIPGKILYVYVPLEIKSNWILRIGE